MRSDKINSFLRERIVANDFPSAVYLVAEKGKILLLDAMGSAVVHPELIEAKINTIYDLASLTKVLVTGLLTAKLIEDGRVGLDDPVSRFLPEFDVADKRKITVRQLVSHMSQIPAWKPLYLFASDPGNVLTEIAETPLDTGPPSVIYSDLNFIILGKLIERVTGKDLDAVASEMIFMPLGLRSTMYNPPDMLRRKIAGSELGNKYEQEMCIEKGFAPKVGSGEGEAKGSAFRDYQIWGEVHDGNAFYMGGVSGHAGLFSTAKDIFKIAEQFLPNYSQILNPETCALFRTDLTPGMNEHRSFAFQLATMPESTAGVAMSRESFGHLGFTGTGLWIDPVRDRVFVLLTNRTHDHPLPFVIINAVRRRFHELAIEFLDENT